MSETPHDPIDQTARDLYAAHLERAEGFSRDTATTMARRGYPERFLADAEALTADLPEVPGV